MCALQVASSSFCLSLPSLLCCLEHMETEGWTIVCACDTQAALSPQRIRLQVTHTHSSFPSFYDQRDRGSYQTDLLSLSRLLLPKTVLRSLMTSGKVLGSRNDADAWAFIGDSSLASMAAVVAHLEWRDVNPFSICNLCSHRLANRGSQRQRTRAAFPVAPPGIPRPPGLFAGRTGPLSDPLTLQLCSCF